MTQQLQRPHHAAASRRTARGARANARHASDRGEGFGRFVGLTTLGAIIPGAGLLAAGKRRAGAAILVVIALLLAVAGIFVVTGKARSLGIQWAVNSKALLILAGLAILGGLIWCAIIIATARAARSHRLTGPQRALGVVLVAALCLGVAMPSAVAAHYSMIQRGLLGSVFAGGSTPPVAGTTVPKTHASDPWKGTSRVNLLLVGSDAGSDRTGVRTDSMIVASIDTQNGNTVLFGLPRNLEDVPFPASDPLHAIYPNGFNCGAVCLLNAVWQQGEEHKNLFPKSVKNPGLQATQDAISATMGIHIDYNTVIDLEGFQGLVDAMGGVYVNVTTKLPIGGSHGANGQVLTRPTSYILPGKHKKLTGYEALWYSRSRFSSDDYARMERQRCMVSALIAQSNPLKMLEAYPKIAKVAKNNVTTDIPQSDLPAWVTLIQRMQKGVITSLPFTDTVVNTSDPNFAHIRSLVQKAIKASAKAGTASSSTSSGTTSASGSSSSTKSSTTKSSSPTQNVDNVC